MNSGSKRLNIIVKSLDFLTWIMMVVTFIVSILTMIVVFGIGLNDFLVNFMTFMPLEISLAVTLFLWGITSIIGMQDKKAKKHGFYSIVFGSILIICLSFGVY